MKKILITGANGYIGSMLATELAKRKDCEAICVDDFSTSTEKNFEKLEKACKGKNIVFEEAGLFDSKIQKLLEGIDTVVHLAYIRSVDYCEKNPEKSRRINVEGTKALIEACGKNKVKRIIFPSSILVYGNTEEKKITEKSRLLPLNEYARQKIECEELLKKSSTHTIILRKANVYGAGFFQQFDTVIPIFIMKALKEKKIEVHGSGLQEKNFLHIKDAMQAYMKAIFSDYTGTINIGGKEDVSINALAEMISKRLDAEITHVQSPRAEPKNHHRVFSSEKAEKELGYAPKIALKKGIEELVQWCEKNNPLI